MSALTHLVRLTSVVVLLLAWHFASVYIGEPFLLPSPSEVIADMAALASNPAFFPELAATFVRVLAAFLIAVALSFALGLPSGHSPLVRAAFSPLLALVKSMPVVSFILVALLWFGSSLVPVFVSVLMILPVMTEAISRGVRQTDPSLLAMARVYRFRKIDELLHIRIPSALPFFFAGAGTSLSLAWKIVVAAEILGFPRLGVGSAMQTAKTHLETGRVLSLTAFVVLMSALTEALFSLLSRAAARHSPVREDDR